jgi:hypothetical protein
MVVQVKKKILVLDQPFLQPEAVRRVVVLEGVHGHAFHLTHRSQLIRPKIGFRSKSLVIRMANRSGHFIVWRTFPADRLSEDFGGLPITLEEGEGRTG